MNKPKQSLLISPIGEPGCGKSTFSLWLTYQLKLSGIEAEFVPEMVKYQTYNPLLVESLKAGQKDFALLRQQFLLLNNLVGHCDIIVNDGALELFNYYGKQRLDSKTYTEFQKEIFNYKQTLEQQSKTIFVHLPVRTHSYQEQGRIHSEEEAFQIRKDILFDLKATFDIEPVVLNSSQNKEDFLSQIKNRYLS